ncbi:GNAT family N-acetyltransferase [Aliivibrio finisterrensis]|uniref:GNAT family N-acetyltransferase n=1 Tax=Aliivibrio finisterrensis TaxID=511998 RepID=A0A6N6RQ88_9GAMM|nr:GNAT family N-acetyltransferase [Aliivibrio finisterrensis]KAB2823707.1 GNAT family N-acetyltransferase [Aliivibrio finisterrensis]
MDSVIRRAKEIDLFCLNSMMYQLHDEHHQQCPELFKTASEIEEEKSISCYLDDPDCIVYVAEFNGAVIGFVTAHFCELVSTVSKPVMMATIDELYVESTYRRNGIAEELMARIEQELKDYGVKELFVEVWNFNQKALDFYNQQGLKDHIHYLRKSLKEDEI